MRWRMRWPENELWEGVCLHLCAKPVRCRLGCKAVWNPSSWNVVEGGEGIELVKKEAKGKR